MLVTSDSFVLGTFYTGGLFKIDKEPGVCFTAAKAVWRGISAMPQKKGAASHDLQNHFEAAPF